jgi:hypothetical protein
MYDDELIIVLLDKKESLEKEWKEYKESIYKEMQETHDKIIEALENGEDADRLFVVSDYLVNIFLYDKLEDTREYKNIKNAIYTAKKEREYIKNTSLDANQIKEQNIIEVFEREGIEVDERGCFKCFLHDDQTPSGKIYEDTNSWYVFCCGEGGDVIKFIEKKRGLDFKEALRYLS